MQTYFWGGYAAQLSGHVPGEGGWDTGVGRSSSIQLNSRVLIENLLTGKAGHKNSTKSESREFASMEKMYLTFFDQTHSAKSKI